MFRITPPTVGVVQDGVIVFDVPYSSPIITASLEVFVAEQWCLNGRENHDWDIVAAEAGDQYFVWDETVKTPVNIDE